MHTGIHDLTNHPATRVREQSLVEIHTLTQGHPETRWLELRVLGYFTLANHTALLGGSSPSFRCTNTRRAGTPGVSALALGPDGQSCPCPPSPHPGPCSLCLVHSHATSCSLLSPHLPQPAVPRSPSKSLNREHCWAGSSLPPGFSRSPSLHHVWPLPALDRPLHPCPEPSAGLIPVAPGGSHRAGRAAARMQGGRQARPGQGLPRGLGYLLPHLFNSAHF